MRRGPNWLAISVRGGHCGRLGRRRRPVRTLVASPSKTDGSHRFTSRVIGHKLGRLPPAPRSVTLDPSMEFDLAGSPSRPGMSAICAKLPAAVEVKRTSQTAMADIAVRGFRPFEWAWSTPVSQMWAGLDGGHK